MIIGLEGVSGVGKTTLAAALADTLPGAVVVPCYYHSAPGPGWMPPPETNNPGEQLTNVAMLLRIETLRVHRVREAIHAGRHVILDRTVDTILAHTRALGRLHDFDATAQALALIRSHPAAVPEMTLLLHADPQELQRRMAHRTGMPAILYDPAFTGHFNDHFREPVVPRCISIDSTASPGQVAAEVLSLLPGHVTDSLALTGRPA